MSKTGSRKAIIFLYTGLILAAGLLGLLFLPQNLSNLHVLQSLINHNPASLVQLLPDLTQQAAIECRKNLTLAAVQTELGSLKEAQPTYENLLSCPNNYATFLKAVFGNDPGMAEKVLRAYPDDPDNYYWLAYLIRSKEPAKSLELITLSLKIDPKDGPAWCLAGLVQKILKNIPAAAEAYSACCRNGDPRGTGCREAGNTFKSLGDLTRAAQYYSLSHDPAVLKLGAELQKQLSGEK